MTVDKRITKEERNEIKKYWRYEDIKQVLVPNVYPSVSALHKDLSEKGIIKKWNNYWVVDGFNYSPFIKTVWVTIGGSEWYGNRQPITIIEKEIVENISTSEELIAELENRRKLNEEKREENKNNGGLFWKINEQKVNGKVPLKVFEDLLNEENEQELKNCFSWFFKKGLIENEIEGEWMGNVRYSSEMKELLWNNRKDYIKSEEEYKEITKENMRIFETNPDDPFLLFCKRVAEENK